MSFLQPLSPARRDKSLDILRGFALAGVLLTFCITDARSEPGYTKSFLDELIDWPKWILIEARMYTMLIIIFGIGFHVQLKKARRKEADFIPVFLRRVSGLIILGFLHAIFLSTRDILIFYGISGAVLVLLRNAKNWQLWIVMALIFIASPLVMRYFQEGFKAFSLAQANNYSDHIKHNWEFFLLYHQIYFIYGEMLMYFMLGYMLSRSGIFQKLRDNKKFRRRWLVISLIATAVLIPVNFFYLPSIFSFFSSIKSQWVLYTVGFGIRLAWQLCMIASVLLYAVLLIGLYQTAKGKRWLSPLASFGQMSLSNYLIQSIVIVPYMLAFNKFDNMPPFSGFILFTAVLALQLLFSMWWMKRYKLGPFEWLLRSFTYWRWQEIRKTTSFPEPVQVLPVRNSGYSEVVNE
jgi:uncharacterized protein